MHFATLTVTDQTGHNLLHARMLGRLLAHAWKTTIPVLVAKGRARVGVAASAADWSKRIRDLQFLDHEGYSTAT